MNNAIRTLAAATLLTLAGTTAADTRTFDIAGTVERIAPMQARTLNMGDHTAVVYYTETQVGTYDVVMTIGPNVGVQGAIAQHRIELSPGAHYSVSLDSETDRKVAFKLDARTNALSVSAL